MADSVRARTCCRRLDAGSETAGLGRPARAACPAQNLEHYMSAREAGLVGHEKRYFRDSDIFVFILSAVQEAFVFMSFFSSFG